ncbi:DNA-directed RNA polymerase subunit delta [Mesomycoplasma lagogenitalium]|uniref:DNA-directed RNA polymerase subunit delta n=1 Tax=Mesomycoplasma lagogenitalium TaxID=171286 RepID=A0ABY8LWG0_9BACT|nr:DNA-directed RNA polymerase subunit delta [Mesomycoplasma lagogenitalium]WGI36633.1 DNA-directed RNA polymerase subunit delta [Mesomycoplasma lagogenitalium]
MKTMINLAKEILNNTKDLEFEEIFLYVKEHLYERWVKDLPKLSDEEEKNLLTKKRGELYKLLTVDSNFKRLNDGKWTTQVVDSIF